MPEPCIAKSIYRLPLIGTLFYNMGIDCKSIFLWRNFKKHFTIERVSRYVLSSFSQQHIDAYVVNTGIKGFYRRKNVNFMITSLSG